MSYFSLWHFRSFSSYADVLDSLELSFVQGKRWGSTIIPLYADTQFSRHHFLETLKISSLKQPCTMFTLENIFPRELELYTQIVVYIEKGPMDSTLLPAFFDTIPSQFKEYSEERRSWTSQLHPRTWSSVLHHLSTDTVIEKNGIAHVLHI